MWFGTVNGLIHYFPENFRNNATAAKTSITECVCFTKTQRWVREWNYLILKIIFRWLCRNLPYKSFEGALSVYAGGIWNRLVAADSWPYCALFQSSSGFLYVQSQKLQQRRNVEWWTAVFSFVINTPIWKRSWFWLLLTSAAICILSLSIFTEYVRSKERADWNRIAGCNGRVMNWSAACTDESAFRF